MQIAPTSKTDPSPLQMEANDCKITIVKGDVSRTIIRFNARTAFGWQIKYKKYIVGPIRPRKVDCRKSVTRAPFENVGAFMHFVDDSCV